MNWVKFRQPLYIITFVFLIFVSAYMYITQIESFRSNENFNGYLGYLIGVSDSGNIDRMPVDQVFLPIGSIVIWPYDRDIPFGWIPCSDEVDITDEKYRELVDVLGGTNFFPILNGRVIAHPGSIVGSLHDTGGNKTTRLQERHLPIHSHTYDITIAPDTGLWGYTFRKSADGYTIRDMQPTALLKKGKMKRGDNYYSFNPHKNFGVVKTRQPLNTEFSGKDTDISVMQKTKYVNYIIKYK